MLKKSGMAILVAGALFAANASAHDMMRSSATDDWSASEQLTVFDPDGSSYSITPVEIEVSSMDPALFIASLDEQSPPEQLTLFDTDGMVYSYEFVPANEVALIQPSDWYAFSDDATDDMSAYAISFDDEDASSTPYVAHFYVSPPTYTGVLEEDNAL